MGGKREEDDDGWWWLGKEEEEEGRILFQIPQRRQIMHLFPPSSLLKLLLPRELYG